MRCIRTPVIDNYSAIISFVSGFFLMQQRRDSMTLEAAKVYNDGGHFIAIRRTTRPKKARSIKPEKTVMVDEDNITLDGLEESTEKVANNQESHLCADEKPSNEEVVKTIENTPKKVKEMTLKEVFNKLYEESTNYRKSERKPKIIRAMKQYFNTDKECREFVTVNLERVQRNLICRRKRLSRKVNLNPFNYFVTFTYNNELHTEDTFYVKLKAFFRNMCHRYKWEYIGVWERSSKTKRLHFHGLFIIPDGTIPGVLSEHRDYNVNLRKMQTIYQSDKITEKFGRNDFRTLDGEYTSSQALAYIMKYMEKTGTEIVSSRNLAQYIVSDILDEDVLCQYGDDENKFVLYDKFLCIEEGTIMGEVSADVIKQMPKAN